MTESNLAVVRPAQVAAIDPYQPVDFQSAITLAGIIAKSRLFPSLQTPEQALVVISMGHDLGMSPMQACRGIFVIEGRPAPSADTFSAVVLASGKAEYFRELETTDDHSTWETKRVGDSKPKTSTFTLAEAHTAGLVKPKSNWEKYPKRMMAARAKAFLARDVYPDLVLGLYTSDEIIEDKESAPSQHVQVQIIEQPADQSPNLFERIYAAETLDALQALARECSEVVPGPVRDSLRAAYSKRKAELTPQIVEQPTAAPMREPGEEG